MYSVFYYSNKQAGKNVIYLFYIIKHSLLRILQVVSGMEKDKNRSVDVL